MGQRGVVQQTDQPGKTEKDVAERGRMASPLCKGFPASSCRQGSTEIYNVVVTFVTLFPCAVYVK